ncbi:MAG: hypothetical protein LBJ11_03335 [Oscillospiraceae bacterium]|nr:hypothetical protein [Oscillospiraceae bacterium]
MATYCPNPNCGRKLKWTDWKPNCPDCGTNILYYRMEERLLADADRVETENAQFQKKMDRAKASLIGNGWAIARLVLLFAPLGALFLPLAKLTAEGPFLAATTEGKPITLNLIKLIDVLSNLDFGALFTIIGSPALGKTFLWYFLALIAVILALVAVVLGLGTSFLAGSSKGFRRSIVIAALGIVSAGFGIIAFRQFIAQSGSVLPGAVNGSVGFGAYLVPLTFALPLVVSILIKAKGGVPVKYKQCYISGFREEEVIEAQAKGITLDDMRAQRAAAEAEEAIPEAEPAE